MIPLGKTNKVGKINELGSRKRAMKRFVFVEKTNDARLPPYNSLI